MTLSATVTPTSITMILDGQTYVLTEKSHPHYLEIREALKAKDEAKILSLLDLTSGISGMLGDRVAINHGVVTLDGETLHNVITERLLEQHLEGFDVSPMCAFLTNLHDNPSKQAVDELYLFMEKTDLPITEDGHLLAYKWVREDYTDIYSGEFDNSIGAVVKMARNKVDDRRDVTCSSGLHFCSQGYLPSYGGYGNCRVVLVKVNPRDVVSIPTDYNNAKARACEYVIVGEIDAEDATLDHSFGTSVMTDSNIPGSVNSGSTVHTDPSGSYNDGDLVSESAFSKRFDIDPDEVATWILCGEIEAVKVGDTGEYAIVWNEWFDVELGPKAPVNLDEVEKAVDLAIDSLSQMLNPANVSTDYVLMTRGVAADSLGITRNALSKRLSRGSLKKQMIDGVEMIEVPLKLLKADD